MTELGPQAKGFAEAFLRGEPDKLAVTTTIIKDQVDKLRTEDGQCRPRTRLDVFTGEPIRSLLVTKLASNHGLRGHRNRHI